MYKVKRAKYKWKNVSAVRINGTSTNTERTGTGPKWWRCYREWRESQHMAEMRLYRE